MPLTPALDEAQAAKAAAIYADMQIEILELVARRLAAGVDAPQWAMRKLNQVPQFRQDLGRVVAQANIQGTAAIRSSLEAAFRSGEVTALGDVGGQISAPRGRLDALVRDTSNLMRGANARVLRATEDVYRDVIRQASGPLIAGSQTTRQAVGRALADFAERGVTGLTDSRGRRWRLDSYAEMALRTAANRASVDGHTQGLLANGHELVMVSDAPQECPLCRPFEGKVFTIGAVIADSGSGHPTLDSARVAGLFHPGCRHRTVVYIDGVTKPLTDTADPEGNRLRQRQRALEVRVRRAKERRAVAIDSRQAQRAQTQLRQAQAELRAHIDSNNLKRVPGRTSAAVGAPAPAPVLPSAPPAVPRAYTKLPPGKKYNDYIAAHQRDLDPVETLAVRDYHGGNAYLDFNQSLRIGTPMREYMRPELPALRALTEAQPVGQDLVTFRGTNHRELVNRVRSGESMVGAEIHDRAFLSTSTSERFANNWVGDGGVLVEIRVPAEARGLFVDSTAIGREYLEYGGRKEYHLVLPPDTTLRVVEQTADRLIAEVVL